jgi:IclR family acetate operon transcriptional repressor
MISRPSLGCTPPHSFEWDFHMAERIAETRSRGPRKRGRTPSPNAAPAGQVQSLTRGLALLERLSQAEGGVSLTDLSLSLGLAASTTHRLLATLEAMGYVYQRGDLGFWYVGVKAFSVGCAFIANRDLVAQTRPFLHSLMEQSGETANLAVLDDGVPVFVDQVQCREIMRMLVRLGSRVPIHASGVGKATLAAMADDRVTELLRRFGMPRFGSNTIDTPGRLRTELAAIRSRGYAFDDEEHTIGLRCVAAAIFDEHGEPIAAISIAGPKPRMPDDRVPQLGAMVLQAARAITAAIGGRQPQASLRKPA